tara:strand:+ start:392 stop:616 length:225 start_codon:yes stop_codon:yes gene_type:complete
MATKAKYEIALDKVGQIQNCLGAQSGGMKLKVKAGGKTYTKGVWEYDLETYEATLTLVGAAKKKAAAKGKSKKK